MGNIHDRRSPPIHHLPRHIRPNCRNPKSLVLSHSMEELFGDPAYKGFVLQDRKRLPSRFHARISGALTSRLI